jgi:rhodanese-related sulfurtransferase
MDRVDAIELFNAIQNGFMVVDTRPRHAYVAGHPAGAESADADDASWDRADDVRTLVVIVAAPPLPSDASVSIAPSGAASDGADSDAEWQRAVEVDAARCAARCGTRFGRPPARVCVCALSLDLHEFRDTFPFAVTVGDEPGDRGFYPSRIDAAPVWLGARMHAGDTDTLARLGIRTVVCVAHDADAADRAVFDVRAFRWEDTDAQAIAGDFGAVVAAVDAGLGGGHGVLVHCYQGKSRSAAAVAAWLVARRGMEPDAAHSHLQRMRSIVRMNDNFLRQLHAASPALGRM